MSRRAMLLLAGLSVVVIAPGGGGGGGKRFDGLTSCTACVASGYGWSVKKSKCGMFANRDCDGGSAPPPRPDPQCEGAQRRSRPSLPHRFDHSMWLPRVTLAELLSNATLASGALPFVLTDSTGGWPATRGGWNTSSLAALYPAQQVDYYPHSLQNFFEDSGGQPTPLARAMEQFDAGRSDDDSEAVPYIIWRHSARSWGALASDISPLPEFFSSQTRLLRQCIAKGASSDQESAARWENLFSLLSTSGRVLSRPCLQLPPVDCCDLYWCGCVQSGGWLCSGRRAAAFGYTTTTPS